MKNRKEEASKEQKAGLPKKKKEGSRAEREERGSKREKGGKADSKRREAEFKSFRNHVEAKKEQMKRKQMQNKG